MKIRREKKTKAMVCLMLTITLCAGVLSGCSVFQSADECPYEEFIVVEVFDSQANYQGLQSGWFGKIVKEKFNMELNIIAPNIAGGGDTLFEVRSAAGNIGDLILCCGENGAIKNLANAGLLYNMEKDLAGKQIMKYEAAINNLNDDITPHGIYAIPSEVSANSPLEPSEGVEMNYGPYVRWDLYAQIGYPKMETIEDILPVLKQMQELEPKTPEGKNTYGFSFFRDWDSNLMNAVKQPCCFYGYDENGFVLTKADGSDYQSIIEEDSIYIRMCHLLFEANQLGLVDPESVTQSYRDCFEKFREGSVLFGPWPWISQAAYNTEERISQGKGFMLAPIEDMQIYSYGCNPEGNQRMVIAIGSQAKDPQRLVDFIDWLYSPEGIAVNGAQLSGSTAGPEGITWEMKEDGPYLTELGKQALFHGAAIMPEELGGGTWEEGTSALNYKPVAQCEKSPDGYYYAFEMWDSVRELKSTKLMEDWQGVMQADSTRSYLEENDMILVANGCSYIEQEETIEQSTIREQCARAIQNYSWNMIFAEDEEEFGELLEMMQDAVRSYGYDKVLELDMQNAKEKQAAMKRAAEEYKES